MSKNATREGSARTRERDSHSGIVRTLQRAKSLLQQDLHACEELVSRGLAGARASKERELLAAGCLIAGTCQLYQGNRSKAAELFGQSLKHYAVSNDRDAALEVETALAAARMTMGNERATIADVQALLKEASNTAAYLPRTWEDRVLGRLPAAAEIETNRALRLGAIYDALGTGYLVIREHHKAASLFEEERSIYRALKSRGTALHVEHATVLNNLVYAHALLGNRVAALDYSQEALKLARANKDLRSMAINHRNLAFLHLNNGQLRLARDLAEKSLQLAMKIGMWEAGCRVLVMLTTYERMHGSLARAGKLNEKALALLSGKEKGSQFYFFTLQQLLIEHARRPSKQIYAKLLRLHTSTTTRQLQLQHEIAQEIARVAEELRMLPDAVQWFNTVHAYELERLNAEQRSVLLGLKAEQEVERLAKEREVSQLTMEKLEMELEANARETKLLAVQLAKKGSFLATLTDQLESLKISNPNYSAQTLDAVVQLVDSIRHRDKDFEQLEARAGALHHEFILLLSERYPELTQSEKKICVLLRLGLSTLEIANVLFTSVRTIETHSLSIRKKLGISSGTRLSKFILEF